MNQKTLNTSIKQLIDYLETFDSQIPVEELGRYLDSLEITLDDLKPYIKFGDFCYQRNLIKDNQWYELLCICWKSGQRSPIHNHAGSTCGLRIMEGICTETVFSGSPSGLIKATHSNECSAGHVCSTEDQEIHQISNLQAEGENLITLHIYSPPLRKMDTYSLYSTEVESYEPKNQEVTCLWGDCI